MMTIDEFCRDNRISRSMFYKLRRESQAPQVVKLGRLSRITPEAALAWRKRVQKEDISPSGSAK
jgi:predicted DNA-binding transcriptional regulator AlpA